MFVQLQRHVVQHSHSVDQSRQTHSGAFMAVPVVFAEGGVTADPFTGKLVDPLCS